MSPFRIKRLAADLQMRRRRLDTYTRSAPWPGKESARRLELARYDYLLVTAAQMLEVPAPELEPGRRLVPEVRAALEDRLAQAGLDVLARGPSKGDILGDGDLHI